MKICPAGKRKTDARKKQTGRKWACYCAPLRCTGWAAGRPRPAALLLLHWAGLEKKRFEKKTEELEGSIHASSSSCSTDWNKHGPIGDGRGVHREAGRCQGQPRGSAPQPGEVEPGRGSPPTRVPELGLQWKRWKFCGGFVWLFLSRSCTEWRGQGIGNRVGWLGFARELLGWLNIEGEEEK